MGGTHHRTEQGQAQQTKRNNHRHASSSSQQTQTPSNKTPQQAFPACNLHLGTLNVLTWHGSSHHIDNTWLPHAANTVTLAVGNQIDILAVQECRIPGCDKVSVPAPSEEPPWVLVYSGNKKDRRYKNGVGFLLSNRVSKSMISYQAISDRVIAISVKLKNGRNLYLVNAYAPTETADEESKNLFYDSLQRAIGNKPLEEILCVVGDFNATISQNPALAPTVGINAVGTHTNDNGVRLINFARSQNLVLSNTVHSPAVPDTPPLFPYSWTWTSPPCDKQADRLYPAARTHPVTRLSSTSDC